MYKSLYKSHKVVFQWTFYGWYGMSQVADYFGPMLGRRRAIGGHVFSATWDISWRIIMVVLHIALCEFVHFHVLFYL